jgi:hypothetical protein
MSYLDKLKQMTAWDIDPTLSEDELNDLLGAAAVEDSAGHSPIDVAWTPAYDLNTAAAAGWLIKAARAAATVDEPTAGAVTSKVFDNCCAMARMYAAKRTASVTVR